jgi:hypothetical protein
LRRRLAIALEQDEAAGIGGTEEIALAVAQVRTGAAEDDRRRFTA